MGDVVQGQTVKQLQLASLKRTFELFAGNHGSALPLDEERCACCFWQYAQMRERALLGSNAGGGAAVHRRSFAGSPPLAAAHLASPLAVNGSSCRARWAARHHLRVHGQHCLLLALPVCH